jgi:hypothetical protein
MKMNLEPAGTSRVPDFRYAMTNLLIPDPLARRETDAAGRYGHGKLPAT